MKRQVLSVLVVFLVLASAGYLGPSTSYASDVLCKATQNTCETGNVYGVGTEFKAGLTGGNWTITPEGELPEDVCKKSEMKGEVEASGTPLINLSSLTLSECSLTTEVLDPGELVVHWTSSHNGKLEWRNWEVRVKAIFGSMVCTFGGKVESGITLTGGSPAATDGTATIGLVKEGGFIECPSSTVWHGNYEVTAPKPLYVSEE